MERLDQRLVGILQAGVLADDGDRNLAFRRADPLGDVFPRFQPRLRRGIDAEGCEDLVVEALLVVGHRHVVDARNVERLDDGGRPDVAEQ